MNWKKPILINSEVFQIISLSKFNKIDGKEVLYLTPTLMVKNLF